MEKIKIIRVVEKPANNTLPPKVKVGMSTIVVVKNRCQFCYAFYKEPEKIVEHSQRCSFRFAETFEACDGKVKYACAVCFDVFPTRADHKRHEQLHEYPGGFPCSFCGDSFLNETECVQHTQNVHKRCETVNGKGLAAYPCFDCGALFERNSFLRLHNETDCGRHRTWNCIQCSPDLLTEDALVAHLESQHKSTFEEEVALVAPKVETEDRNVSPMTVPDPLYVAVEDGMNAIEDAQEDGLSDIPTDEHPIEKAEFSAVRIPRIGLGEKYECKYCDRKYVSKRCFVQHVALHGSDGSLIHRCEYCNAHFKTVEDQIAHTKAAHNAESTCQMCDKSFRNAKMLQNHIANICPMKREMNEQEAWRRESVEDSVSSETEEERIAGKRNELKQVPERRKRHFDKEYECKYCGQKFCTEYRMKRHIISHGPDGSLVHKCECCPKYFRSTGERDAHTKAEHSDEFKCDICEKSFRRAKSVKWHKQIYHNITPEDQRGPPKRKQDGEFVCKICGKRYIEEKGLEIHIAEHGPDGSLVHRCNYCQNHFKTKEEKEAHMVSAHKERFTCNICGKFFQKPNCAYSCQRSHRTELVEKQTFVCVKCGMSFKSKTYLNNHERSDCGRIPMYKCDECGKTLSAKQALKTHMLSHKGEKNFPCNFCDARLSDKAHLKTHIKYKHTGERPFKCDQCDKRFVDKASLRIHTTVHTGVKRYVCYGCGDRFPSNSSLHKHRNVRKNTCALVPIQPPLPLTDGV